MGHSRDMQELGWIRARKGVKKGVMGTLGTFGTFSHSYIYQPIPSSFLDEVEKVPEVPEVPKSPLRCPCGLVGQGAT